VTRTGQLWFFFFLSHFRIEGTDVPIMFSSFAKVSSLRSNALSYKAKILLFSASLSCAFGGVPRLQGASIDKLGLRTSLSNPPALGW
jgi:hypothetical protein